MQLHPHPANRPVTLVWLDADEAILLHWGHPIHGDTNGPGHAAGAAGAADARNGSGAAPRIERLRSGVLGHRRATGTGRHDPTFHSGGGADPDDLMERRRQRMLEQYLRAVAVRIPPGDRVVLVGPGLIHERLGAELRTDDARHGRHRPVETTASGPRTERQLVAWSRELAGVTLKRRLPAGAGMSR